MLTMQDSIKALALFTLGLYSGVCMATDDMQGYFKPVDSVKKEGDDVTFECQSPTGYTSLNYPSIEFVVEHNGVQKVAKKTPDITTADFTSIVFSIADVSKQHAGTYTCLIIPTGSGSNVTLTTHLFIVEAEEKTSIVRKGKGFKLDCLGTEDLAFSPAVDWSVNNTQVGVDADSGMYTKGSSLYVKNAGIENAFQDILCKVTSKTASEVYGSVDAAFNNGSGTEFQKTLSVVEVSTCKVVPCQLPIKARVYGDTPVRISWRLNGVLLNSSMAVNDSVSTSTTDVLNTTMPVLLIITGGQNEWSQNISLEQSGHGDKKKQTEADGLGGGIIAAIVLSVILVIVAVIVIIYFVRKCKKATSTGHPSGGVELQEVHRDQEQNKPLVKNGDNV